MIQNIIFNYSSLNILISLFLVANYHSLNHLLGREENVLIKGVKLVKAIKLTLLLFMLKLLVQY